MKKPPLVRPLSKRDPSPRELVTIWAHRAQKATPMQSTGVFHVRNFKHGSAA